MFLRVQNIVWILGCVTCLIAFIFVFFPSWKTVFKQSEHLSIPSLSFEIFSFFLSQSLHLSIVKSINREISYLLDPLSLLCYGHLDTSRQLHLSKLLNLDTCLNTSWHLYLSRFTEVLYIGSYAIQTSFPRSLSIYPWLFISQTLSSLP